MFNVPLSVFGFCYFFIAITFCLYLASPKMDDRDVAIGFMIYNVIGVLFCFYFIFLEIIIGSICLMCTLVHIIVFITFYFAWRSFKLRAPGWRFGVFELFRLAWSLNGWLILAVVLIGTPLVFTGVFYEHEHIPDEALAEFGRCLRKDKFILYHTNECPYCRKQRRLLGIGMNFIDEVNCSEDKERCEQDEIVALPTWRR